MRFCKKILSVYLCCDDKARVTCMITVFNISVNVQMTTLFFTFWINLCGIFLHPLYVSVVNMDVNASDKHIVMSVKIFTDDLETVLHNKYGIEGWIGTPNEHGDGRRLVREYVNERFSITVNRNEKLALSTDSIAIVEDATWFYMKGISSQPIRFVEIDNRLLTDFFSKQTNLVIIGTGGEEKGYKLDRKKHKIELSL